MYNLVASNEFYKFCQMNDISLKDKIIQIKHFDDVIMERETRLIQSVDGYLMKQIEDIIDDCSIVLYSQNSTSNETNLKEFYNKTFDTLKKLDI